MTESWLSALKSPELIFAVMLTAKTCLVAGAGFLVLAPPLAWLFARREGVGVRALSFFVTLPLVFPPVALGYLLLLLIGRSGPLGGMLDAAFQSSSRLGRSIWLPSSRDCRSSFARFRERLQANSSKRLNLLRACTAHRRSPSTAKLLCRLYAARFSPDCCSAFLAQAAKWASR